MKVENDKEAVSQTASSASKLMIAVFISVLVAAVAGYLNFGQEKNQTTAAGHGAQAMVSQDAPASGMTTPAAGTYPRIEINTQAGKVLIELYPDAAPKTVSDLISLIKSGYYDTDTVVQTRPQLGFVVAKIGEAVKKFEFDDESNNLTSRRGSVAISKSATSNAYVNNLFFGYDNQPELEKHYVIIGQVVEGLERIERSMPDVMYQVKGFRVMDDAETKAGSDNIKG